MMTLKEKFIAIVDNDIIKKSDAIIVLEGDGDFRIPRAVDLFKKKFAEAIVFSGEIDNPGYGSFPLSKIMNTFLERGITGEQILHENLSTNTREQAVEVIKLATKKKWTRIILVASHFHQYRAYLTFLRVLQELNSSIIIFNAPVRDLKWFEDAGWGKRYDLLENEFERIEKYKDHIASYESAIEYQEWKEKQI